MPSNAAGAAIVLNRRARTKLGAWAFAVLVLIGSLIGTLAGRSYFQRGMTYDTAVQVPIAHTPINRFGINAKLEEDVTDDQVRRDLEAIKAAGFGWVRIEIQWSELEPDARGVYWDSKYNQSSWTKWDHIFTLAQEYGINVVARIDRPPAWSHPSIMPLLAQHPDWEAPPDNAGDYGDVVAAIVARYRGKLSYVQLWNEPNLRNEWAGQPVSPVAYTTLLRVGAERARAANPNVVIITASLAPNVEPGPSKGYANMSDLLFLQGMYAAGAAPYFDVVSVNPYGLSQGPWTDETIGLHAGEFPRAAFRKPDRFDFSRPVDVRAIMVKNRDASKPIWASEFGWNRVPADWTGNPSPWGSVSPGQQASYSVQAYERARVDWPWMGVMSLWYLREPVDVDPRDPTPYFTLLNQDWSPTPLYHAIQHLATKPSLAYTGVHSADVAVATYGFAGAWRTEHSQDHVWTYQVAGAPEAFASFPFTGNSLEVVVRTSPRGGRAYVRVDQQPNMANMLPTDGAGNAYLDLYSPTVRDGVRIEIAKDLADGLPHQLDLVIKGARDPASTGTDLAIAAYSVGTAAWAGWSYLLALEGLGLAACAAWPAVATARWSWHRVCSGRIRGQSDRAKLGGGHAFYRRAWAVVQEDRAISIAVFAAGALYYVSPSWAWSVVGLAAFGALALVRLDAALLLAIPAAPLLFLPKHIGAYQFSPAETVISVCTAAWVVRGLWRGALEVRWDGLTWTAVALLAIALVSLLASTWLRYSLRELRLVIVEPALWFVMLQGASDRGRRGQRLVDLLVATGVAVAAICLVGMALGRGVVAAQGVVRLAGIYPSPDNLGLFLGRILPLAGCMAWLGTDRRRLWHVGGAMILTLALGLTFSRGAWLGVVAAGLAIGALQAWWIAAGCVAVLLLLLAVSTLLHVARLNLLGTTTTARLLLWRASIAMARDHPVFGIGMDQFVYLYPQYRLPEAWREPFLSHPHNVVLDFWLQLGVAGLAWLVGIAAYCTRALVGMLRRGVTCNRAVTLGIIGSLTASLAHGLLDNSFFVADLALVFWVQLSIVGDIARDARSGTP